MGAGITRRGAGVAVIILVVSSSPLFFHEMVQHEELLLVDLEADVLGDVWDEPVHKVAHEHHHVLHEHKHHSLHH